MEEDQVAARSVIQDEAILLGKTDDLARSDRRQLTYCLSREFALSYREYSKSREGGRR
jgi:hypothetical protein